MENVQPKEAASVPVLLRYAGGAVLIASGVTFLLEGWATLGSLQRYFTFFTFVALLAVAGVFCSRALKEQKGARLFLGFATAAVPALFSQLGTILFDRTPLSGMVPAAFVGGSLLCASAVVLLGFSVLLRSQASRASPLFLLLNGLLVIPTRDNSVVPWLIWAGAALWVLMEASLRGRPESRTAEGLALRLILAIPVAILTGRAMLYASTDFLWAALSFLLAGAMFAALRAYPGALGRFANKASAVPALVGWAFLAETLTIHLHEPATFIVRWLAMPWILVLMSLAARSNGRWFRFLGAAGALVVGTFGLSIEASPWISASCAATGILLVAAGARDRERAPLFLGMAEVLMALLAHVGFALTFCMQKPWLSLAALGVVVVLLASILERYHERIHGRWAAVRTELSAWR